MTLTQDEALKIIDHEQLTKYVWFQFPANAVDCVAIYQAGEMWCVANTDERAVVGAVRKFDNESDALELFVRRLRLSKYL